MHSPIHTPLHCWLAFLVPEAQTHEAPFSLPLVGVALQFTSRVAVQEEALLMELSASLRLWGGLAPLKSKLVAALKAQGWTGKPMGQGTTAGQALALMRLEFADAHPPAQLPLGLPLHTMSALRPHVATLARMGCNTWGDLQALPRAGVARRFGAPVLLALDQALGAAPHSLSWVAVPEVFDVSVELPALADSGPALLHATSRLLQALQTWLQSRQQGVLVLDFSWKYELRRYDGVDLPTGETLPVRTAQPTQDMAHLRRLLAEFLNRTELAAPANQIRLVVRQSAALPHASASLLIQHEKKATGMPWHELIERLGARLGAQQVQTISMLDDHRPEAMQLFQPAVGAPARAAAALLSPESVDARLLPSWLIRPAIALRVEGKTPLHHGPLQLLTGPQRLESGWWNEGAEEAPSTSSVQPVQPLQKSQKSARFHVAPASHGAEDPKKTTTSTHVPLAIRDYFVAYNHTVGLVWVYRERPIPTPSDTAAFRWFLQGVYG